MPSLRTFTTEISGHEYIGDSLSTINQNFEKLDEVAKNFNTLVQLLSTFATAPGASTYTQLSSQFQTLSSLAVIP